MSPFHQHKGCDKSDVSNEEEHRHQVRLVQRFQCRSRLSLSRYSLALNLVNAKHTALLLLSSRWRRIRAVTNRGSVHTKARGEEKVLSPMRMVPLTTLNSS